MRKALPKGMNPTRLENRHGGGVPDLEVQWPTGSAFVELKAPASTPRTLSENLKVRPHLFGKPENVWREAMADGLTARQLGSFTHEHESTSTTQAANLASSQQKAWHARRFANGGVSFFLQSTKNQRSKLLFSPYISEDDGSLRLGLVCESEDWAVVLYALRLGADMHAIHVHG